jgi:hypothetical protein
MNSEILMAGASEAVRELAGLVTRSLPGLTTEERRLFWQEVARLAAGRAAALDTRDKEHAHGR